MTDKPDLTRIWGEGAPSDNVVDPDTTTPGKFSNGWQAEVPPFEHFNFIQKQVTEGLAHINEQGIAVWDDVTTYPVGGLAKGSDGNVYKALVSQSDNDPVSDNGTNWVDELNNRVIRVTSIAAMEAFPAVVGVVIQTLGYHSAGDGGGNTYQVVAGGTGTADGGNFIDLDSGLQAKSASNSNIINVKQWGAVSDGVTDDSSFFNAALNYAKTLYYSWENESTGTTFNQAYAFEFVIPPGQYRINSPVNMTSFNRSHSWWYVEASGAVIFGDCPGKTVFDFTDSRKCSWFGGTIICDNEASVTRTGLQLGRKGGTPSFQAGRPADSHHFQDLEVKGYFTLGSVYNYAAEDTFFEHVALKNDLDDNNAYCLVQDGTHYWGIVSDFVTPQPLNTPASFLRNTCLRFDARKTNRGGPMWICSQATNHEMISSYLVGYHTQAIKVFFNVSPSFNGFVCDVHLETDLNDSDPSTGLQRAFTFDAPNANTDVSVVGLKFRDNFAHAQAAIFIPETNINTLDFVNADVDLCSPGRVSPCGIFGVPSKIGYSGRLRYDSSTTNTPNYENGFDEIRYFSGEIIVRDAFTQGKINQIVGNPKVVDRAGAYQKNGDSTLPGTTGRYRKSFLREDKTESAYIFVNTTIGSDRITLGSGGVDVVSALGPNNSLLPGVAGVTTLGNTTLTFKSVYSEVLAVTPNASSPEVAEGYIVVDDGSNWSGVNPTGSSRPVFYDGTSYIAMT